MILFVIAIKIKLTLNIINGNYQTGVLEEGNYDLLDFTDYHNLKLIITTSKKIYKGVPPQELITTNANLINATSLITYNENYLLAACTQDYFLIKIKLSDGSFSPLIEYNYFSDLSLQVPITSCSLSLLNDIVFIGYTRIDYFETATNKTNIVFKFYLDNLDSEEGPEFDQDNNDTKYFIFTKSTKKTESSRQISCEPLLISNFNPSKHSGNNYRLVCIHEDLDFYNSALKYQIYSAFINDEFNGFEGEMKSKSIYRINENSGFRIYRLNNTFARCILKKGVYDIYLKIKDSGALEPKYPDKPNYLNSFSANLDLFDFNYKLLFSSEKIIETNISNLAIYNESSPHYIKLYYNLTENSIKRIQGYYDNNKEENNILFVYKTLTDIKYFTITNIPSFFEITTFVKEYEILSNEQITFNFNEIPEISSLGNIQIEKIVRTISNKKTTEEYPIKLTTFSMNDNIFVSEKSLNTWYEYSFGFIDEDESYLKIYYLENSRIEIKTCFKNTCPSCKYNFSQCDDCPYENQAQLSDSPNICYDVDKLVKGYKYNEMNNLFEKCYKSCSFCSEISDDISSHKCESCESGYLPSYKYP